MSYDKVWPLLAMLCFAIGVYLYGSDHGLIGLWSRTSTGRLTRRTLRRLRGQNVVLASGLPSNVHNYRIDNSTRQKRVMIFPEL
jgi:hypothetical protein